MPQERLNTSTGSQNNQEKTLIVVPGYRTRSKESQERLQAIREVSSGEYIYDISGGAENSETRTSLEQANDSGTVLDVLNGVLPLIQEKNPKLLPTAYKLKADLTLDIAIAESSLEISKLRAQVVELNTTVQKGEQMRRFGNDLSFNKQDVDAFIEQKVIDHENHIRALEQNVRTQKKEQRETEERRTVLSAIDTLKREINELNEGVQKNTIGEIMTRFGAERSFNRAEIHTFVEAQVLERERKIHELENSLRAPEPPVPDTSLITTVVQTSGIDDAKTSSETIKEGVLEPKVNPDDTHVPGSPKIIEGEYRIINDPTSSQTSSEKVPLASETLSNDGVTEAPVHNQKEEIPIGMAAGAIAQEAYVKETQKEHSVKEAWKFVRDRFKGALIFGFWQFHQAERFRAGTKEVAQNIFRQMDELRKAKVVTPGLVMGFASVGDTETKVPGENKMEGSGADLLPEEVSGQHVEENNRAIEAMVVQASGTLRQKLARYKNESGKSVIDDTIIAQFETNLRNELTNEQYKVVQSDVKDYKRRIRKQFDEKYWKRYVYGGIEFALGALGYKYIATKVALSDWWTNKKVIDALLAPTPISGHEVQAVVESVATPTPFIEEAVQKVLVETLAENVPMKDMIWHSAAEWLEQNGITNPTNAEVMEVSKQVATDSGIGVKEWGIEGDPVDTNMQQGHLLTFTKAQVVLKAIALARTVAGA